MRTLWKLLVVLAVVVAACGGSDDDAGGGVVSLEDDAGDATTSTSRLDADEAVLEVTRCMREQGIDVPDIGLTADGRLDLRPEDLGDLDLDSTEFQDAFTTCVAIFQESGAFDVELDPELEALIQDQLQDFARCMRDEGIDDFPDPQLGDGPPFPLGAFTDFEDPAFQDALEACRQEVSFAGFSE